MQYSVLLSALFASVALAMKVTSPDNTTTWNDSGSNTIKWTSVSTDPTTINIVLINNAVYPNTQTTIASNVQTSTGSYTVKSLTGNGVGYQVNLMGTTNDQILAQSDQFTLSNSSPASGGGSSSSAFMSSSTSSTSTSAASSSSTSLTSMTTSGMSTMSTASTASTGSTASTASTGSTMSTATASGTPTGSAGAGSTSGTASSTAASSTPSSGATMNAISFAGLGFGGLLALLA